MARLARLFGVVAVVSGRPVSFLEEHLALPEPSDPRHRVRLVGLYGLERSGGDGRVVVEPAAAGWSEVVAAAAARLRPTSRGGPGRAEGPGGHRPLAPGSPRPRSGSRPRWPPRRAVRSPGPPGRMSAELRPPLDVDKGSVVGGLAAPCSAACYLGDDLGDLPPSRHWRPWGGRA